jgi:hypothetical protein
MFSGLTGRFAVLMSNRRLPATSRTLEPSGRLADETSMQFFCEDLDLAGQVGVAFELQFLRYEVVVGFGLLEGGLAVLADHHERRQEGRFK